MGRPDLRWHDLRHTGLTMVAITGATTAEIMARGGHSTPTAALRYQHVAKGREHELAALLSKLADDSLTYHTVVGMPCHTRVIHNVWAFQRVRQGVNLWHGQNTAHQRTEHVC